jgi:anti-sigma factor RsiW
MTRAAHPPGGCRSLLEELFDYVDGELSPGRCRALERHLDRCPCCGELAANLRKTIRACQEEGRRALPPGVRRRAKDRIAKLLADM